MNIQDDTKGGAIAGDIKEDDIGNADIRKIKLNYIQLNKRATTASNPVGRKIPQKGMQNEYINPQQM